MLSVCFCFGVSHFLPLQYETYVTTPHFDLVLLCSLQLCLAVEARGKVVTAVGGGGSVLGLKAGSYRLLRCHNDLADIILICLCRQGTLSQH